MIYLRARSAFLTLQQLFGQFSVLLDRCEGVELGGQQQLGGEWLLCAIFIFQECMKKTVRLYTVRGEWGGRVQKQLVTFFFVFY